MPRMVNDCLCGFARVAATNEFGKQRETNVWRVEVVALKQAADTDLCGIGL